MFHKHLDQASKRYKHHPNVAAMYTSLPPDKAKTPEQHPLSQPHLPKIRDFAYEAEPPTSSFIAAFTDSGFRSPHRRIHNGDLLCQAGIPAYEMKTPVQVQDPPADLERVRHPGFHDDRERQTSEETAVETVSSDLSGTTRRPSVGAAEESSGEEGSKNRRCGGLRDNPLIVAVAVCMLEHMKR